MVDGVRIDGLQELSQALRELPKNIGRNVLRGSVNAGATVIRQEAVQRAPISTGPVADGHPPPGTLKKAIYQKQIREKSTDQKQVFYVGVRHGSTAGKKGSKNRLSRDAYYWRFVEFGTVKMAAQPFLRPAFEAMKMAAVERIKEYITKRLPLEVEKLRGSRT